MIVKEMTIELLEMRHEDLLSELARLKSSLEFSSEQFNTTGLRSDPGWLSKIRYAIRIKGREHQLVLVELAKRKRELRHQHEHSRERCFIKVAAKTLPHEVFRSIMAEADLLVQMKKD